MKKQTFIATLMILFSFSALSIQMNDIFSFVNVAQLLNPEPGDGADYDSRLVFDSSRSVVISPKDCEEYQKKREEISEYIGTDRYSKELKAISSFSKLCSIYVRVNEETGDIVGIELSQNYKNGSTRNYVIEFKGRSKQDVALAITDNSALTGKMSHDLLETAVQFIPRKEIPYIDMRGGAQIRGLVLSTGETVEVDFKTHRFVGGVLEEMPVDMTQSRHSRKFVRLNYKGNGIMIRADRRSGTPRHIYKVSFNSNEKISKATITHKGKTCFVAKELIWENAYNPSTTAYLKYESDEELLSKVINPECGWNLTLSDIE